MLLSGGIWIAFLIYWSAAARNSAPATKVESGKSRAIHQVMVNGALLLLFIPVPGLTGWFLPASRYLVPIGLAVQAAFFLLAVWARRHLGRNWSGEVSIKSEHQLVRSGPYRFIRHPIYTAMFGMYIGTSIVSAQIHSLVALALLAIAYARKIPMEEKALREAFGADYETYRRHSGALIPGLF
jgi:protein-S-isoprenylcysteine O-methyltransferase Ste14